MTTRGTLASAGASAAPDDLPGALISPYLGWQLFGYSRRRTNALLDDAANMIERLESDVVVQRTALADASSRLGRAEAYLDYATARLEASHEELARVCAGHADDRGKDAAQTIGKALASAHSKAADIVARAKDDAVWILSSARAEAARVGDEADHLIEQDEPRAHALVEQAADEGERLRSESETPRARVNR